MARKYFKKCPSCKSNDVISIVYGMPGSKMQKDYMEGKGKLGGCGIIMDAPDRYCNDCEHKWRKTDNYKGGNL